MKITRMTALIILPLMAALIGLAFYAVIESKEAVANRKSGMLVVAHMEQLLAMVIDAETGQRGYLLMGDESYLAPFFMAKKTFRTQVSVLQQEIQHDAQQLQRLASIVLHIETRLALAEKNITLRRQQDMAAVMTQLRTGLGKQMTNQIRQQVAEFVAVENQRWQQADKRFQSTLRLLILVMLSISTMVILGAVALIYLLRKSTQQQLAQHALQTQSQYSRSLIEASLDPLVTISAEGKITDVNTATEKVTGADRASLIGSDFANYFTDPEEARKGYQQVFSQGSVTDYPLAIRHVSGKVTDVLYNASVYKNTGGKVLGVFAAARDVTESNKVKEELRSVALYTRSLIESSLDPTVTISRDGKITDTNQAAVEITGRTREQLIGSDFCDYFTERDKAREGYQRVFSKGFVTDFPLTVHHIAGKETEVFYNASLYHDEHGEVSGVFAVARDMTSIKKTEAELRQANSDLESFSYSVSHDLRAPLRAIDGFSAILREDYASKLDEEGQRLCQVVSDNAKKMGKLIEDILFLSRASRHEMALSPLDVKQLAQEVWDSLATDTLNRNIEFKLNGVPVACADTSAIREVLQNLIGNAIKFTRGREPAVIEISGHTEGKENIYYVRDNGVGFDMAFSNKLFGLFQRLHSMTEFEGTGVGLAIVKRFITKHGGRVWAESTPNQGATFWFTLPSKECCSQSRE